MLSILYYWHSCILNGKPCRRLLQTTELLDKMHYFAERLNKQLMNLLNPDANDHNRQFAD